MQIKFKRTCTSSDERIIRKQQFLTRSGSKFCKKKNIIHIKQVLWSVGGWGYSGRCFGTFSFHTDYPISHESFEKCSFMQTVLAHVNQVDLFSQLIPSPQKSAILTSFSLYSNSPDTEASSPLPPPFISD